MNWSYQPDELLDARTVYTGAYGFRDSDALGHIWAHTSATFLDEMRRAINETARSYRNDSESVSSVKDLIWYVGPFPYTVREVVESMEDKNRAAELRDNIRTSRAGNIY